MDWMRIFERRSAQRARHRSPRCTPSPRSASTSSSATRDSRTSARPGSCSSAAYGTAIAVDRWGLPLWVAFLVGMLFAVVLGLLLGIPTLRLRADYLAIVTISAAEILRIVVNFAVGAGHHGRPAGHRRLRRRLLRPQSDATAGTGCSAASRGRTRDLWVILVHVGLVALFSFGMYLAVHSPWGRVVKAIREDEDAARSLGKNVYAYKMQSLVIGGVIGGLAGIMLVIDRQFVEPKNFESSITFFAYAALILGGMARIFGPILGCDAVLVPHRSERRRFLRQAVTHDFLGIGNVVRTEGGRVRSGSCSSDS